MVPHTSLSRLDRRTGSPQSGTASFEIDWLIHPAGIGQRIQALEGARGSLLTSVSFCLWTSMQVV